MALTPEARFTWVDEYEQQHQVWADLVQGFDEYSDARSSVQPTVGHILETRGKKPIITTRPAQAPMGTITLAFVQEHENQSPAERAAYLREAFTSGNEVELNWTDGLNVFDTAPLWRNGSTFLMTGQARLWSERLRGGRFIWRVSINFTRTGVAQ